MILNSSFGTGGAGGWNVSLVMRISCGITGGTSCRGLARVSLVRGSAGGGGAGGATTGPKAVCQALIMRSHSALISSGDLMPKAFAMRFQSPKVMPARSSPMASAILVRSSSVGSVASESMWLPISCSSCLARSSSPGMKPARPIAAPVAHFTIFPPRLGNGISMILSMTVLIISGR